MSEPFLEEQLRRIKEMSQRISEARDREEELARFIERLHELKRPSPLDEVRDFRADTTSQPKPADKADERPHRRGSRTRRPH